MITIQSVFGLINRNNGEFVSVKQSQFYKSHLVDGVILVYPGSNVYGNTWHYEIALATYGIQSLTKISRSKAGVVSTKLVWSKENNEQYQKTRNAFKINALNEELAHYENLVEQYSDIVNKNMIGIEKMPDLFKTDSAKAEVMKNIDSLHSAIVNMNIIKLSLNEA